MNETSVKTDFEILGISANSSLDELRAIYKRKVLRAHPDKGGDITEFHRIQAAYNNVKNILGRKRPVSAFKADGPPSFKRQKNHVHPSATTARDSIKSEPVVRPTFQGTRTPIDSIKPDGKTKLNRESSTAAPKTSGETRSSAVGKHAESSKTASVKLPPPTPSFSSSSRGDPAAATELPTEADRASICKNTPVDAARSTMDDIATKINILLKGLNLSAGAEIPGDTLKQMRLLLNRLERADRKLVLRAMSIKRADVVDQLETHVRLHKREKVINAIYNDLNSNLSANLLEEKLEEIRAKLAPLDRESRKSLLQRLSPNHLQQLEAHMLRHRKEAKQK
eukprot:GEMP01027661.1.p1 GENE.GEMP01027661.1~~GEMP01027661.1.p1  ORF type:complete len:338 (-),score=64.34 GEMP01027661.1:1209-2222(-)